MRLTVNQRKGRDLCLTARELEACAFRLADEARWAESARLCEAAKVLRAHAFVSYDYSESARHG